MGWDSLPVGWGSDCLTVLQAGCRNPRAPLPSVSGIRGWVQPQPPNRLTRFGQYFKDKFSLLASG